MSTVWKHRSYKREITKMNNENIPVASLETPEMLTHEQRRAIECVEKINRKDLERWETEFMTFAVTGNAGVGKSSFINAIRGIKHGDVGYAEESAGVLECTKEPTRYKHNIYPNIIFWDLPGVGTNRFKRETYLAQVEFERYDFYIIVGAGRFTENDFWLAEAVREKGKRFFFVRTKIDVDISSEKKKYPASFDETTFLGKIHEDCRNSLPTSIKCDVFLIDNTQPQMYDFGKLAMSIINASPSKKRDLATFATCILTEETIKEKERELRKRIGTLAVVVSARELLHILHGNYAIEELLLKECMFYQQQLQLTDEYVEKCRLKSKTNEILLSENNESFVNDVFSIKFIVGKSVQQNEEWFSAMASGVLATTAHCLATTVGSHKLATQFLEEMLHLAVGDGKAAL